MQIDVLYQEFQLSSGICTDTRAIKDNCIFFALKGERFNGNTFAAEALKAGARLVVIDEEEFHESKKMMLVDNVLLTLQKLANHHRKQIMCPVIGITGTNGKTTTKELMVSVLSSHFKTFATKGNLNNHIGVPLTLLSIPVSAEMVIIEMGANHPGDIKELCEIAEPEFGIITNVGKAHLEGFGDFEGVKRTKKELYDYVNRYKGVLFVNSSNTELMELSKGSHNVIEYFKKGSFLSLELLNQNPFLTYQSENGEVVTTTLIGDYNFENIVTSLSIAKYFKVPMEKAHKAITDYVSSNNRSQVMKTKTNTVILDAYNANPTSMKAAVLNLKNMQSDNKVVVLGDMFELGEYSKEEHKQITELVDKERIDQVYFCGAEFFEVKSNNQELNFFLDIDELKKSLIQFPIKDSLILVKGSRGMQLEKIVELL